MALAKAVKKVFLTSCCCTKSFPFSAFMMLTALLYFSICSCKNVEGNELAQQKLKPKLISCCSKCSIVSLSWALQQWIQGGKSKTSIKTWNRWQRKYESPFAVFPSTPQAPVLWPLSTKQAAECLCLCLGCWVGSCSGCWSLAPVTCPAVGQPGPAKAPYELCEAGCHASHRALLSFHPVLPCLHNWLRYCTPCPPCLPSALLHHSASLFQ